VALKVYVPFGVLVYVNAALHKIWAFTPIEAPKRRKKSKNFDFIRTCLIVRRANVIPSWE
jgi:hypothetical protein